jgi:hypothetical protein
MPSGPADEHGGEAGGGAESERVTRAGGVGQGTMIGARRSGCCRCRPIPGDTLAKFPRGTQGIVPLA